MWVIRSATLWWGYLQPPPRGFMPHAVWPRSAAPRTPAPVASHCWPIPLQEILKHSKAGLAQSLWGLWGPHKILFEPSKRLWQVWDLILNAITPLLPSFWGFFFALGRGVSFFGGTQHSAVDGCSAVSYNFEVLTGKDECMSFYSAILWVTVVLSRTQNKPLGVKQLSYLVPAHSWLDRGRRLLRPFVYNLNQIPYDYTVEVTHRFKGLDLIECLKNYRGRLVTLYKKWWPKTSPKKRNAKGKMVVWGGLTNNWVKKRCKRQSRKGKTYPSKCRVPKNSKER